jgi:TonB family protein
MIHLKMRRLILFALCIVMTAIPVLAQKVPLAPFEELDKNVQTQPGGWNGDKSSLSRLFDNERRRLGERFEPELLKYVARDPERHYWISLFLEEPSYLHGSKPLLQLSLLLKLQGISLLRGKTDEESAGQTLAFDVLTVVLSQKLGLTELAIHHKNEAEVALLKNPNLGGYHPALSEDDRRIYDAVPSEIKTVRTLSAGVDDPDRPKARISAGVLNGKAIRLPKPVYPAEAKHISGQVRVSIIVDEQGKVSWARAISGPASLLKAAEAAALKAEFTPTLLEGKPEKVSGLLIYNFVNH